MDTVPLHILDVGRQHHLSLYTSSVICADPIDVYYCVSAKISVPLYISIFDKHAAKSWAQICHVDRSTLVSSVVNASPPLLQSLVMKFALDNTDPKSEFRFSYLCISLIARWPSARLPMPDILQRRWVRNSFHVDANDSSALMILTWIQSNDVVWELDFAI